MMNDEKKEEMGNTHSARSITTTIKGGMSIDPTTTTSTTANCRAEQCDEKGKEKRKKSHLGICGKRKEVGMR